MDGTCAVSNLLRIRRKVSIKGPIENKNKRVPKPIGPPNEKPAARANPSIRVVDILTDKLHVLQMLSIKVSIGPAPKFEKMVSADPLEIRMIPKSMKA